MKELIANLLKIENNNTTNFSKSNLINIVLLNILFAILYVGLAYFTSNLFKHIGVFPSPFWPSASIAFVAMLLNPRLFAFGIFTGSIIANEIVSSPPLIVSSIVSCVNVGTAFMGTQFLQKYTQTKIPFYSSNHSILFIMSIIIYSALAGFGGVLTGYSFGVIPEHKILIAWQGWTLSDTIGTIFLAPFLILLLKDYTHIQFDKQNVNKLHEQSILDRLERIIVFVISIAFCAIIFLIIRKDSLSLLAGVYLLIPPMIWSAIRFSMKDSWLLYMILGSIITISTLLGYGPFHNLEIMHRLVIIESILFSLSLTLLIVGCLVSERRSALIDLKNSNSNLEKIVADRTLELNRQIDFQQHLIDSLPNPLFYKDIQGVFLGCNRAYEQLLQLPKEAILKKHAFQVVEGTFKNSSEVIQISSELDSIILKNKKPAPPRELMIIDAKSNLNHYIFYKNPIQNENAEMLGIIGVLVDISERKEIELKLQESEQLFKVVAETTPFAMIMTRTQDHTIIYANPMFYEMFSIPNRIKPFQKATDFYVDPNERLKIVDMVITKGFIKNYEVKLKKDDGTEFWGLLSASLAEHQHDSIVLVAVHDITQRRMLEEKLRILATTDGLTGIANRRHFMETATRLFEHHKHEVFNNNLSVFMIDIDFFKKINDSFGHDIGDIAIKSMAQTAVKTIRINDVIGRLGGEEFAIILPNITHQQAMTLAEKLRSVIEKAMIPIDDERYLHFTISLGVSHMNYTDNSIENMLSRADKGLYYAKNNGRNQVHCEH